MSREGRDDEKIALRRSTAAINAVLAGLPVDDRIAALVVSIITDKSDTENATTSLVSLIGCLSRHLPPLKQYMLSEMLRDAADTIEFLPRGSALS